MENDMIRKLTEKIQEAYFLSRKNAEAKAEQILRECPEQFLLNVLEWADSEPLTDIRAGKYSIAAIMAIRGDSDFLGALDAITEYLQGDADRAELRIWRARR